MRNTFKIIVLTPENFVAKEIESVCKLFSEGLPLLHIRKPYFSEQDLREYIIKLPSKYYRRIVLHSHYKLVKEFKLKGAHLPEKARASKKTIELLKRNEIKIISTSFHSTAQVKRSRRKYEYVFLSPVFDSVSKQGYRSKFILENLIPVLKTNNIIGMGGVTDKNILSLKETGFTGAATIGYVWESKSQVQQYKKLLLKIK